MLFQIALLMQDLGRLASDLLLFYTREFGFVRLPDAFTTGSSIMPQKRNPDVFELVRGRTATAQACLAEVLGITAKLPSGYQRDLQLIKAPLFRSIDVCLESLGIMAAAIPEVQFVPERIRMDAGHSCGGRGQRAGREGRHSVPRGVPARRREIPQGNLAARRQSSISVHENANRGSSALRFRTSGGSGPSLSRPARPRSRPATGSPGSAAPAPSGRSRRR